MRILLIRLREIGDVVFTTPAIRALRLRYPSAHIAYLVEPLAHPVVGLNPHVNEVLVAPRHDSLSDLRLGWALHRQHFDVVVDFHGGPRASLLTWMTRAPIRIGYNVPGRGWMYTTRIARPRELRPRHAVENQWDLIEPLGIARADSRAFAVEMPLDATAVRAVRDRLSAAGLAPSDQVIVVHVSAGNPFRRWPQESFAEVVAVLAGRSPHARVIVTSGPSERDAAARVIALAREQIALDARDRVLAIGEFSLPELRALLERAALFIGGDSGPLHIAATTRVPIVGLYGPTLPIRSAPWRDPALVTESVEAGDLDCRPCDQRVCIPGDFRCLTRISARAVAGAAERALTA